jgi:hypothetical protein
MGPFLVLVDPEVGPDTHENAGQTVVLFAGTDIALFLFI